MICALWACTANVGGSDSSADDSATRDPAAPNADPLAGCASGCHGAGASNAPPRSNAGAIETTVIGVGAHQAHLGASPAWHQKIACADCHVVPDRVDAPGHIDSDGKAEVTFSARAGGSAARWDGATCTTTCHGQTAWGATSPAPTWTRVDGTQSTCGSCHGAPPPPPHPAGTNCATCHPTMEQNALTFRDPASHINGIVDVVSPAAGDCTSCHGSATSSAPPKDLSGNTAATVATVGAHQAHLATSTWHHAVVCSSCHVVPKAVDAPGHIDGDNLAEVRFDTMNPLGVYTKANATCTTLYCHGDGRGSNGTIPFTATGALACNDCHGTHGPGMSGEHTLHLVLGLRCSSCHADVIDRDMTILKPDLHVNGVHEVKMAKGTWDPATKKCSDTGCHFTLRW